MALRGSRELRQRLKAIRTVFKPVGKSWAEKTRDLAKTRVTVRTGKTKATIRVRNASLKKAAVEAKGGARFLEAGTRAHIIRPKRFKALKWNQSGQPMFARKVSHPATRAKPFLRRSGRDVLAKSDLLQELLKLWNQAA
jgi:hypothetical protein